jgi:Zn-dependent protease
VPVRFGNLRNPKRDMIWVALAGPGANWCRPWGGASCCCCWVRMEVSEPYFFAVCKAGVTVNVVMFVFNLFPLPPLDGGRILVGLLPYQQAVAVSRVEPWGFFIVMALVISGVLSSIWMRPLMSLTFGCWTSCCCRWR